MIAILRSALAVAAAVLAAEAAAQITFYPHEGFNGRSFTTSKRIASFGHHGIERRVSSVVVRRDRWEVCEDARFSGRCIVLLPGRYRSLAAIGMDDHVSSVRIVGENAASEDDHYLPGPLALGDGAVRKSRRQFLSIEH